MAITWQDRVLNATDGTKTGAIIRCALNRNGKNQQPRFVGTASCTSDGFLLCNFVTEDGEYKMGAFVGRIDDLIRNVGRVATHCKLLAPDVLALGAAVDKWIAIDYRPGRPRPPGLSQDARRKIGDAKHDDNPNATRDDARAHGKAAFEASLKIGGAHNETEAAIESRLAHKAG